MTLVNNAFSTMCTSKQEQFNRANVSPTVQDKMNACSGKNRDLKHALSTSQLALLQMCDSILGLWIAVKALWPSL